MSRRDTILISSQPQGKFGEGQIYGALKPGTRVQIKTDAALVGGRFTYEAYAPGTDGERREVIILLEDTLQGRLMTDAYVSGDRCFVYSPIAGEEMNVLFGDTSGTADDVAVGGMLISVTGTGKFIPTTGTVESEPFQALEAITDPVADQLVWAKYTGY